MATSASNQNSQPPRSLVIHYLTLRRGIGALGVGLPLVLIVGSLCGWVEWQGSISAYYHTAARDIFVGTLWVIGFFLFSYRGYDHRDNCATNAAGFFALGVSLFPVAMSEEPGRWELAVNFLHLVCAALFFLTLSTIALFQFTKSTQHPKRRKRRRNGVYVACGAVMLFSILSITIFARIPVLNRLNPTFWLETLAIWAFGLCWRTKGRALETEHLLLWARAACSLYVRLARRRNNS